MRTFADFRASGLLWLLNTTALHPRGFALAFHYAEEDDPDSGEPIGWSIVGDGSEPWTFADPDECFSAVEKLLSEKRP